MSELTISVIIPAYNAELYVAQCLDSVLNQTLPPNEIIVINDGSTDGTLRILENYGTQIRVENQPNRGSAHALNWGVELATGNVLAFLDADDYWEPNKLAQQVTFMQTEPTIEACFCHVQQFISPDLSAEIQAGIACPVGPQPGWHKSTMMIRRAAFDRVGRFGPTAMIDFVEWFGRAREVNLNSIMLPSLMAYRRLHRSGQASNPTYNRELLRVLKAYLDRRKLL